MVTSRFKSKLQAKRVLDFQKRTIDQLQMQLDDLCAQIEPGDAADRGGPAPVLNVEEALVQIEALEEQLVRYGKELATLYMLARDKERLLASAHEQAIAILIQILELKHPLVAGHAERVAAVSQAIARRLMLKEAEVEDVRLGGLLHDVGSIATDAATLGQNRALLLEELEQVRDHPDLGARIVAGVSTLQNVAPIVRHHHERVDGRGYPRGVTGGAMPLGAKIVAVAEIFDGLAGPRPYRQGKPVGVVVDHVRRLSGTHLDVRAVLAFIAAHKAGEIKGYSDP